MLYGIRDTNFPNCSSFFMVSPESIIRTLLCASTICICTFCLSPIPRSSILASTWSILLPVAPRSVMLCAPFSMASLIAASVSSFIGLSFVHSISFFFLKKSNVSAFTESKSPIMTSGTIPVRLKNSIPESEASMQSKLLSFIHRTAKLSSVYPPVTIR